MKRINCVGCGCLMYAAPREPSDLCTMCWVAYKARPEPDWSDECKQLPGYWEPDAWIIQ